MIVQHNLTAMNSNRMLGLTTSAQAKSTEKLSSGYKINRAADDAAGLSISEKMRRQIRGLTQASANAQDGISCVQTAEGAMNEIHDMLQRMNELANKAGNGTMSEDDRQNIQDEIDQLVTEIDRISETTKFNETYLLKGDGEEVKETITTDAATKVSYVDTITGEAALEWADSSTPSSGIYATVQGVSAEVTDSNFEDYFEIDEDGAVAAKAGVEFYSVAADTSGEFGDQITSAIEASTVTDLVKIGSDLLKDASEALVSADDITDYFDEAGKYLGGLYEYDTNGDLTEIGAEQIGEYVGWEEVEATSKDVKGSKDLTLSFQVGADTTKENKIDVTISAMSAKGIGINGLKVTGKDSANADAAVNTIEAAIKQVSEQRSALGAIQNRLEHTINNLDNIVENTTAAEAAIRDTDMADEMVRYSNNNILAQAGQSMLAQANQSNQGVLSLLG